MNKPLADSRAAEILLVEDDEADACLLRLGLEKSPHRYHLHRVTNGVDGLAFLRKTGAYATAPTPDLVLLDLNLPLMDGRAVMAAISADPMLRPLPVVVVSVSDNAEDIQHMYALRCSSYFVKPFDFAQFEQAIRQIVDYWVEVVLLPA